MSVDMDMSITSSKVEPAREVVTEPDQMEQLMTFSPPRKEGAKLTAPPRFDRNKSLAEEEDRYESKPMQRNTSVP